MAKSRSVGTKFMLDTTAVGGLTSINGSKKLANTMFDAEGKPIEGLYVAGDCSGGYLVV